MRPGMRMVGGDALEIDFSVYDDEEAGPADEDRSFKHMPREVKYFDTASINIRAGDGGKGCCAFRREKFTPHGGPSGGNGGNGGSVWAVADEGLNSLTTFRNRVHWKAKSGVNGSGKDMHGANAADLDIKVPPGVIIRRQHADEDEPPVAELLRHGMSLNHHPSPYSSLYAPSAGSNAPTASPAMHQWHCLTTSVRAMPSCFTSNDTGRGDRD